MFLSQLLFFCTLFFRIMIFEFHVIFKLLESRGSLRTVNWQLHKASYISSATSVWQFKKKKQNKTVCFNKNKTKQKRKKRRKSRLQTNALNSFCCLMSSAFFLAKSGRSNFTTRKSSWSSRPEDPGGGRRFGWPDGLTKIIDILYWYWLIEVVFFVLSVQSIDLWNHVMSGEVCFLRLYGLQGPLFERTHNATASRFCQSKTWTRRVWHSRTMSCKQNNTGTKNTQKTWICLKHLQKHIQSLIRWSRETF